MGAVKVEAKVTGKEAVLEGTERAEIEGVGIGAGCDCILFLLGFLILENMLLLDLSPPPVAVAELVVEPVVVEEER